MKNNWWSSLQVKIIAWSFIPTLIILSAVAWLIFFSYQKVIGDQAVKQDQEIVATKMGQFYRAVGEFISPTMVPIVMEIDMQHDLPLEARVQNILDRAKGLDAFDGGIFFVNQQGVIFRTQPAQPELLGQDWSDTPSFRSIKATPNFGAYTDLFSVAPSGNKIVCITLAMANPNGVAIGAGYYCWVIYPLSQNAYYQALSSLDLGPNFYVTDRNKQVIYSSDPSEIGSDVSGKAYLSQLLQGESRSGRFRDGTKDMVVSYEPMGASIQDDMLGWIAFKEQSWTEIMQPFLPYQRLLLALLALGVVVPALVTAYGVRHITNPIQKLIHAAQQVTAGQFKQRIEVKTGDEIETLADQFNLMSAELDDSYSSLEKKVDDRTKELGIMNAIISVASRSLDIQEILEEALDKTVEQMGFEAGAAFKLEAPSKPPLLVAFLGLEPAIAANLASWWAVQVQRNVAEGSLQVTAMEVEQVHAESGNEQLALPGFHSLVSVPLSTKGNILGLFLLAKREPGRLSPEELSLLNSVGQQIGVAMENAHLYEQAEQTAVAGERNRLARELHDAVTQTLFSANLIADVLPRIWKRDPQEGMQNLEELRQLTRGALAEMRTMLLEMRPEALERSDIKSLLTQLADAFIGRVRVPVSLIIQGDCALANDVKIAFYRVAQEALNNIAKHSGARQVDVRLECQPGQLRLLIKDDGLGFDPAAITLDHLGIAIMRERANSIGASLQIESQLGQGTTVALDWNAEGRG
jgi:nitrate/nitrite-specific signal transduction histidine kinase